MRQPPRGLLLNLLVRPVAVLAPQKALQHIPRGTPHSPGDAQALRFRFGPQDLGHGGLNDFNDRLFHFVSRSALLAALPFYWPLTKNAIPRFGRNEESR